MEARSDGISPRSPSLSPEAPDRASPSRSAHSSATYREGDPAAKLARRFNESLHLIVLPTEACNFRCVYCYEDFRFKRMLPEVVRGVKALLTRRVPELTDLTLSWFGGEPLLARDVVEDIMGHVQGLAKVSPGFRMTSDATTNGYLLTPALAIRLLDLGVSRYQISFDGPREWHDRKRVRVGGRGTFDKIWGNLLALRGLEREYRITIRVHVERENAAVIPCFIDECAEAFGSDPRFEIFIRGLSRFGGPNDDSLPVFERKEGEAAFESLRSYARSRGLNTMQLTARDSICYAARPNSFVVRADGRLNKCTISLSHPNNQVGRIREDGSIEVDPEKVTMWMRGFWSGSGEELKCPMKGYADPPPQGGSEQALGTAHGPSGSVTLRVGRAVASSAPPGEVVP